MQPRISQAWSALIGFMAWLGLNREQRLSMSQDLEAQGISESEDRIESTLV